MNKEQVETTNTPLIKSGDKVAALNLTVSEGKRLIALGIAHHPLVQEKIRSGMIIITKGTTNTYIAEELADMDSPRGSFMTGNITPVSRGEINKGLEKRSEVILINGKVSDISYTDALKKLSKDDIVLKGGNMLNYERKQAAVCIGAPDGGTTYKLIPYVGEGKAQLIIPIGLEKEIYGDLLIYEQMLDQSLEKLNDIPRVHMFKEGTLFTEIEAIKQFGDVQVFPFASGGIAGREGGISLVVSGKESEVQKILDVVKKIQGEVPFID